MGRATPKEHKEWVQKEPTESDYNRDLEEEMALNRGLGRLLGKAAADLGVDRQRRCRWTEMGTGWDEENDSGEDGVYLTGTLAGRWGEVKGSLGSDVCPRSQNQTQPAVELHGSPRDMMCRDMALFMLWCASLYTRLHLPVWGVRVAPRHPKGRRVLHTGLLWG